tara:strand:- start:9650 stop:10273 length:624 start_codon:yes stop_codon:yes gene_type:complete
MNELEIINKHPELRKGFSWIIKNSTSNNLPYHNFNHLLVVVRYVYQACQYYNLPEKDEKELLMAALFHDVNHSGGSETDDVNVQRAKFVVSHVIDNYDIDIDKDEVCGIIGVTQYPYVVQVEDMNLKQLIIRDADLMQVFEYNWIQQNMMGLSQEMNIPLGKMISGQKDFLNGVQFNTDWGLFWEEQRWRDVKDKLTMLEELYNMEI